MDARKSNLLFSVIVPVYNNNGTLQRTYDNITNSLKRINCNYEILFVDDGSKDESLETLRALKSNNNKISIISLEKNYNQSIAILAGLEHATGDYPARRLARRNERRENQGVHAGIPRPCAHQTRTHARRHDEVYFQR